MLTCQPWSRRLLSTVLSHMTASPAWKSLNRVHFLCRKTPRHLSNSEVEAWMTVFLGPGGRGFCTNFSHVGLCVVWLLFDAGGFVYKEKRYRRLITLVILPLNIALIEKDVCDVFNYISRYTLLWNSNSSVNIKLVSFYWKYRALILGNLNDIECNRMH